MADRSVLPSPRSSVDGSRAGPDGCGALVRWSGGVPVVLLRGDVDVHCSEQVASVCRRLRWGPHQAVVDAAELDFIDVSGLRAVMELADSDGEVSVLHPSRCLLRLLGVLVSAGTGLAVRRAMGSRTTVVVTDRHGEPGRWVSL